eukprot:g73887.t1
MYVLEKFVCENFPFLSAVDLPAVKSFIRQAGLTKCVIRDMECPQQEQESEDCLVFTAAMLTSLLYRRPLNQHIRASVA